METFNQLKQLKAITDFDSKQLVDVVMKLMKNCHPSIAAIGSVSSSFTWHVNHDFALAS